MKNKAHDFEMKSPWVNWADSVRELFKQDPDIRMTWSDDLLELHMYVKNSLKRLAIRELLPEVKYFDKVKVKIFIELDSSRRGGDEYIPEIIEAAFTGNPLYKYKHTWNDPEATSCPFTWIEMEKEIIQYPSDNLAALYGDRTVLPAELAKEVLGDRVKYIYFDTINPDRPPVPDGEDEHGPFGK